VRLVLVLLAGAAIGLGVWLTVGSASGGDPLTKADIEHEVAKRPRGHVLLVLCNQEILPTRTAQSNPPQTWTCDSYLGRSSADERNGPSYLVIVSDDKIRSIKQVPPH
jgi:hypothetical protein